MEIHSEYVEPATSSLSYDKVSFSKTEDSGYHSFTPGSFNCGEVSSDYLDHSVITSQGITGITGQIQIGYFHVTPDVNIHLSRRYNHSTGNNESSETPPYRRGFKRPHSSTAEKSDSNTVATPTSFIAGKIKTLDVNENKENDILSPVSSQCSEIFKKHLLPLDLDPLLAYPTTPVKRNCRRSPCRKSGKRSNFAIHSLSCESKGLQSKESHRASCKAVRTINFWPDQKVDIIKKLYHEAVAVPPVMKILSYLSNEDICNFCSVSEVWGSIWKSVSSKNNKKKEFEGFIKTAKENQENKDKVVTLKAAQAKPARHFREIQNEIYDNQLKVTPAPNPPVSPRTIRFKNFAESASLDSRSQMPCVRCCLPAKINEESSGEVWVDCTSKSCLFQFCKFCKCPRHSGKYCFQYDLNGPSPSKRKKTQYAVGSKKSRRNLSRL